MTPFEITTVAAAVILADVGPGPDDRVKALKRVLAVALALRGQTQAELAQEMGIGARTLNGAICGGKPSRPSLRYLAEELGVPYCRQCGWAQCRGHAPPKKDETR